MLKNFDVLFPKMKRVTALSFASAPCHPMHLRYLDSGKFFNLDPERLCRPAPDCLWSDRLQLWAVTMNNRKKRSLKRWCVFSSTSYMHMVWGKIPLHYKNSVPHIPPLSYFQLPRGKTFNASSHFFWHLPSDPTWMRLYHGRLRGFPPWTSEPPRLVWGNWEVC